MMGLQLIFVVETNKKCKSDWIYIKDTIDRFYQYDQAQVKFSVVYMDGKGKYKSKEKEISGLISQYAAGNKSNQSHIICCFDCDDYDNKPEDADFLKNVKQYCEEKGYDFVWFCKDIERVYLGKKIEDCQKKKESAMFKAKKLIDVVEESKLNVNNYQGNASNIMLVISKYLSHKQNNLVEIMLDIYLAMYYSTIITKHNDNKYALWICSTGCF